MNIRRKLRGMTLALVLLLGAYAAYADTVTVSTYYPSPYGSYQNLDTSGNTFLATTAANKVGVGVSTIPGAGSTKMWVNDSLTVGSWSDGNYNSNGVIISTGAVNSIGFSNRALAGYRSNAGDYYGWYSPDGGTARLWTYGTGDLMSVAKDGRVGIGVVPVLPAPASAPKLEVAQNNAIKLGSAYLSSGSTGDYVHLANNEWYDGSVPKWYATAAGALLQIVGQDVNFYPHDANGGHIGPTVALHTASGNINISGTVFTASDARFKTDIQPLEEVLPKLRQLRGVRFEASKLGASLGVQAGKKQIGVIGQELEKMFPELVIQSGPEKYRSVDYSRLSVVLLEALKEMQANQERLQGEVDTLKKKLAGSKP